MTITDFFMPFLKQVGYIVIGAILCTLVLYLLILMFFKSSEFENELKEKVRDINLFTKKDDEVETSENTEDS